MKIKPSINAGICFIFSGVASISYQLIWLREAISHFGVITPVISVFLSVFMLGLAIGTYFSGLVTKHVSYRKSVIYYIAVEFGIAALAITVPHILDKGYSLLLAYDSFESAKYLFLSALIITVALLPACILIGATLPLMMSVLEYSTNEKKNFGALYCANLTGAMIGCILPVILIELKGTTGALYFTTLFNLGAAVAAAGFLFLKPSGAAESKISSINDKPGQIAVKYKIFLFITGFVAIGSELLWIKAFAPVTGSSVYAFAIVLGVYLYSNMQGSNAHLKSFSDKGRLRALLLIPFCALFILFALSCDMIEHLFFLIVLSIIPVSYFFGYITPAIIDDSCEGNPNLTARAYIYNFAGCILGPLFTGYILFPMVGLKLSLIILACILASGVMLLILKISLRARIAYIVLFIIVAASAYNTFNYEDYAKKDGVLNRDLIGYIAGTGKGFNRSLTVNGIGMTRLNNVTKNMVELPAAFHNGPANKLLIICMGMGTTLRSSTYWPFESITLAELSRGVTKTFPYFHEDSQTVLNDPRVKIVVDDGRRYLLRTKEKYDIITIDPPPPVEASGSGLLYSDDFIAVIADSLNEGGILAHWFPDEDKVFVSKRIVAAIAKHFKYIKMFKGFYGGGFHVLASNSPIKSLTIQEYIDSMPDKAKADISEYSPDLTIEEIANRSLQELDVNNYITANDPVPPISDEWLYNEFFILRKAKLIK